MKTLFRALAILLCLPSATETSAQVGAFTNIIRNPGGTGYIVPGYVMAPGDTQLFVGLREVQITAPRSFMSPNDYRRYQQYRKYAASVYPYAHAAVKTYRQLENETRDLSNRKRKKRIGELQDQMEYQFKEPLKKLNRVQGYILCKMIEKDLQMSTYDLVKDLKGGFNATYWNQFSKFYGYDMREGYVYGKDAVLDAVLTDFALNY